jgi:hypothetical protein
VCPVGKKNKKISRNEQKIERYKQTKELLLTAKRKRKTVFAKKISPLQK